MDQPYELYDPFTEAGDPEGEYHQTLAKLGWEEFFSLGEDRSVMHIQSWRRNTSSGETEYMVDVWDVDKGSPFIKANGIIALMDLFTRWAPAVQAASVVHLIDDVMESGLSSYGTVEQLAARVAYGLRDVQPRLRREKAEAERRGRELRAQREARRQGVVPGE